MKKTMMALALCLISATIFAGNRRVEVQLPAETPSVTVTIDNKTSVVKPTKAVCQESDNSIICSVFAGKDKASVTLPIAYDTALTFALKIAEFAHDLHIISDIQWSDIQQMYNKQVNGK